MCYTFRRQFITKILWKAGIMQITKRCRKLFNFWYTPLLFPDAVLITGSGNSAGNTTELYQPSSGVSCSVGTLPVSRSLHTLESSGLMCGGYGAETSCLHWSPDTGIWEETLSLDVGRYLHVSWTPGTDTYLMGGYTSNRTTTLIKPDGTQEPGFDLKYDT